MNPPLHDIEVAALALVEAAGKGGLDPRTAWGYFKPSFRHDAMQHATRVPAARALTTVLGGLPIEAMSPTEALEMSLRAACLLEGGGLSHEAHQAIEAQARWSIPGVTERHADLEARQILVREGVGAIGRAERARRAEGDPHMDAQFLGACALALYGVSAFDEMLAAARASLALVRDFGAVFPKAMLLESIALARRGEIEEALAVMARWHAAGEPLAWANAPGAITQAFRAQLEASRGNRDSAIECLERAVGAATEGAGSSHRTLVQLEILFARAAIEPLAPGGSEARLAAAEAQACAAPSLAQAFEYVDVRDPVSLRRIAERAVLASDAMRETRIWARHCVNYAPPKAFWDTRLAQAASRKREEIERHSAAQAAKLARLAIGFVYTANGTSVGDEGRAVVLARLLGEHVGGDTLGRLCEIEVMAGALSTGGHAGRVALVEMARKCIEGADDPALVTELATWARRLAVRLSGLDKFDAGARRRMLLEEFLQLTQSSLHAKARGLVAEWLGIVDVDRAIARLHSGAEIAQGAT